MEILEKLRQFLLGFPGWDTELSIDFAQDGPGCAGLFPAGVEETARRRDLLGNMQVDYLCRFILRKRMQPGQDSARWMLDFQNWVTAQNTAVQVEKAKAQEVSKLGAGLCTVHLAVSVTKEYEREDQNADNGFVYG